MSDFAEIYGRVLDFLRVEWARKDERALVSVGLFYAPGSGYRDEEIRKWVCADEPDVFLDVEKLVGEILELATIEADAKPSGKHRFVVRCTQHGGSRPTQSFALSPSYTGGEEAAKVFREVLREELFGVGGEEAAKVFREVFREVLREAKVFRKVLREVLREELFGA